MILTKSGKFSRFFLPIRSLRNSKRLALSPASLAVSPSKSVFTWSGQTSTEYNSFSGRHNGYYQKCLFHTESAFHDAADETLEMIQDAVEDLFDETEVDVEVSLAAGVLTLSFPPHGTWVINKQTPNQQIWWSSPVSGPRRYEYEEGLWVHTRSIEDGGEHITLTNTLAEEVKQLYGMDLDINT
mmetsp:Transcript_19917/g.23922  ORF Transcript_19917/g.23922 Transcript_19917/m.23922 type:complete len:184 (-) Transcript_19917:35-586(-)|eukprot:CAMPEP_0195311474 /NCGR_PEP_ID=MMETSP0708-20121125/637_1 /TAXON_ID=33640 /ORGANISM="Asterionellopsis glacialis, Strain CCMP134" /LENGTH=183 /DNA_ID=CAMNT_0040375915 /DNA_START=17 /DNA_END=568 /DNA_ORIENTATION=+